MEKEETGVEAAWVSEIKSRLTALDEGRTETIPWEEVKKRLQASAAQLLQTPPADPPKQ